MLYDRWWKTDLTSQRARMSGGQFGVEEQKCKKKRSGADNMANALGVVNIGGIFVVLLCGLAFAITIAIIEFCWKTSSLNTSSRGDNKLMQTSPNRRNSRRRSTSFKIRTRKSLCAEIAGTLVPYTFQYSNKTATCVSRQNMSKKRKTTVRSSNNGDNQTIECDMYDYQPTNSNDVAALNEQKLKDRSDSLAINNKTLLSIASNDQYNTPKMPYWSYQKSKNDSDCENTYDNVPGNNCELHDDAVNENDDDDENYFYRPSTSSTKYQDQYTSTRKLKKKLNNSLPSIPPVVPPHAKRGTVDERNLSKQRVYVPSLDRYVYL